jgi:hypothetical protein
MTIAYLAKNAASLANANWSDTSGFAATYPTLVINDIVGNGSTPVTTDIDKSGITEGVFSFNIYPGARGVLGTPANPVEFDADNESSSSAGDQASAEVTNYGSGFVFHYQASGDDNSCRNASVGPGNELHIYGGTVVNAGISGGLFTANQSTVITNVDAYGGRSEIEYNATPITLFRATGGEHYVYRKVTAFEVGGNARVYYYPDGQVTDFSSSSVKTYGGYFTHDRGAIPTMNLLAGTYDTSNLREATAPGGTAFNVGGAKIIGSNLFDDSNVTYLYGTKRDIGGAIPAP